ncbi:CLUMA_CG015011, isoform A [Clunio marinus]|uniref:CLUMA_CG015011, isoform A n=1 Tax=Clunio marinus TaxID=568069 RepID=A0A1J1INJ2_9DIPT|nr:CLUMA_CG015011, isoform A [Clunio marinus]
MSRDCIVLSLVVTVILIFGQSFCLQKIDDIQCQDSLLYPFVFGDHAPRDNRSAGNFTESLNSSDLYSCVDSCCKTKSCNVAMFYNQTCFLLECITSAGCLPVKRNSSVQLEMVLVRTVPKEHLTWEEVLKQESEIKELQPKDGNSNMNFMNNFFNYDLNDRLYKAIQQMSSPADGRIPKVYGKESFVNDDEIDPLEMEDSSKRYMSLKACVMGVRTCQEHEECQPINLVSNEGFCRCRQGYYRYKHKCIARSITVPVVPASFQESTFPQKYPDADDENQSSEPEKIKLQVTVESKNIQLPKNEASLTAIVVPDDGKHTYLWSLVDKPENDKNGTITDQTRPTVRVSNLAEGLYRFKITVTGTNSYGEAFANVTVSHANRINKPPTPIITPNHQVIKLPNQHAVLDGSTSFDDDKIESWKWEFVQGPINYSPTLQEQQTIELDDLKEPGNYTFKLTVTDSDKAENTTTAIIEVVEEMDYPPQANAGADVILYLPHNNITLNGTLSTDDHQIVSWEWTKDANDESKAVDMQNTHTPFLELSHLEEGRYTFELKVTDAKGQNSSSKVHVFVKPPTNLPPLARAGRNSTITLPTTWILLNATESTDDIKITQYYWKQISGPSTSMIIDANSTIANATMLTLGDYMFEVMVIDESNNNATDRVRVTVIQEKNAAPVARIAGGNLNLTLPLSVLILNGSSSSDDLKIVSYLWTRESDSLAVGNVIGGSDHGAVLMLTGVVAGTYKFKLTVSDEQGLTGVEIATVTVNEDPLILNLVEVVLTANSTTLSQQELDQLKQKILLLLGDNMKLNIRNVLIEDKTNHVIVVFYVSRTTKEGTTQMIMNGLDVQRILKEKYWKDYSILGSSISEIRTVVCQNECSGHGQCNIETRACTCDAFWMPDIFFFWGVTEANCDWSILYVIVFIFFVFMVISGICWGLTYTCRHRQSKPAKSNGPSRPSRMKRQQKYALIHSQDDEIPSFNRNTLSDDSDDTDSDVLFENSRQKSNGIRNGFKSNRTHKLTKLGRRIKT